jgi:hypothetical protein
MAESARAGHLRRTYALTEAQYAAVLKYQHGRCAVCDRLPKSRRLEVDHDHKSGQVRGLLCWFCNKKVIGRATEPDIFENAAEYLKRPPALDILGPHVVPKKKPRKRRSRK